MLDPPAITRIVTAFSDLQAAPPEQLFWGISIEVWSLLASTGVSLALLAAYVLTYSVQKKQAKISKTQMDMMESLERPKVEITGYRPAGPDSSRYSTSALEVKTRNIGNSPALNLTVELVTGFPEGSPLSSGRSTLSLRDKLEDDDWFHEWGESLDASGDETVFIGEPLMVTWKNIESDEVGQTALEFLDIQTEDFENIDDMRLRAWLTYEGIGENYQELVFDYIIPITAYGGMRAALEQGRPYNDPMGYEITSPVAELDRD